jgi:hypothetical protein
MQQHGHDEKRTNGSYLLPVGLIVMSSPFFMAYYIKTLALPSGLVFVFFYSWSIVSVFVVPALVILELGVLVSRLFRKPMIGGVPIKWHAAALMVGCVAITVALWVRHLDVP